MELHRKQKKKKGEGNHERSSERQVKVGGKREQFLFQKEQAKPTCGGGGGRHLVNN